MSKFFVQPEKVKANTITIDTEDVSHIKRVLRMNIGCKITVCDSAGWDYETEIVSMSDKEIVCSILKKSKSQTEPRVQVTLYQALPKSSKMEYIIQKTTELGITRICPVSMSRCVVKIDNKKDGEKKSARWQKIAESAAKQSGRGIIPEVLAPISFDEAVKLFSKHEKAFVPYECEQDNTINNEIKDIDKITDVAFMVGPEGGFDPKEIEILSNNSINTVTLGRRILRTETAGEAVLTMIMYQADEFKY